MSYKTTIKIHFDEADPAGIAFAGGIFTKMHRVYEEYIEAIGIDSRGFFLAPETITPLRHVEAEYFLPLLPLEDYEVEVSTVKISKSSFQLAFEVRKQDKYHARVVSTHVTCDPKTMAKIPLPQTLRQSLEKFASPEAHS